MTQNKDISVLIKIIFFQKDLDIHLVPAYEKMF